ncbi:hypothetical protein [Massilia aerilata]|uniref:Cupin domain-containing protein n=1 Tax=Massilia aerilata TaxID=453817 RepID=A0ABW0S174_9BURK
MIKVTYSGALGMVPTMRQKVDRLQQEVSKLPQYEPATKHYFHAGMYCREVWRHAGVLVIGKVHKKEHFYLIVSGTVVVTTDDGVQRITGPQLLMCKPGTKRAVYSETDALCMTFHVVEADTVEDAEEELVEPDEEDMYEPGNRLQYEPQEVLP